MQKKSCERIPGSLEARFFCGNSLYNGTITNLSEKGMCISTGMCLPYNSMFEVLIPLKEKVMEVLAKVRWVKETNGKYDTMGVELMKPPENYLDFVDGLKSALKIPVKTPVQLQLLSDL